MKGKFKTISTLVSGTAAAHLLTSLAIPINTRLYTPDDFNTFSVFSSIVAILAPVACLRYDAAIVLPDSDEDAASLLYASFLSALGVALSLFLCCAMISKAFLESLNLGSIDAFLWLIPISVFVTGTYIALQSWLVRSGGFSAIAKTRIVQASSSAGTQIGCGFFGIAPAGLLFGYTINFLVGSILFLRTTYKGYRKLFNAAKWASVKAVFQEFSRFPKYSVWEGLANGLSNSAPLIIIAAVAHRSEAGFLTLSLFVLQAPLSLLGNSIGQVYLSGAPSAHREGRLAAYTDETLSTLVKLGLGPMLFAAIVAPYTFGIIFGSSWERSGYLISWMVPWFFLQFLASPICNALHVTGHQKAMMWFHVIGAIFRVGCVALVGLWQSSFVSEAWAITGWLFYAAYLAMILRIVRLPIRTAIHKGTTQSGVWVVCALVGALIVVLASSSITKLFNPTS